MVNRIPESLIADLELIGWRQIWNRRVRTNCLSTSRTFRGSCDRATETSWL